MRIIVTGSAGFIGNHVALRLLERGDQVAGLDSVNEYYDVGLKEARLKRLTSFDSFSEARFTLEDTEKVNALFGGFQPERVVNLAAQAGVRYSVENPRAYIDSNLVGFSNILEACRHHGVQHLVYASTSSVYGANTAMPFSEHQHTGHPITLYAATKKANEMMAHAYAHLFRLPVTGLRFFTVYGPWGRPDMALFKFTKAILAGEAIELYNHGNMQRDFTYIDDIVEGIIRVLDRPAQPDPAWSSDTPDPAASNAPYRLYNIGAQKPVQLNHYVETLESVLGIKAEKIKIPMQPGDVPATWADVSDLERDTGFIPRITVEEGVRNFVAWYRAYYHGE